MKAFWKGLIEWKTAASLLFTGSVILCGVVMFLFGADSIPLSTIVSLLIVSAVGSFMQFLAFSDRIIKKMRYTVRMIVFIVPFFALIAASAYFFRWFPLDTGYWLTFCVIFLVVFIGMTVGFEIYFRVMGRKYDGLLGQYRKQKETMKHDS
jgi:hypothetical protein